MTHPTKPPCRRRPDFSFPPFSPEPHRHILKRGNANSFLSRGKIKSGRRAFHFVRLQTRTVSRSSLVGCQYFTFTSALLSREGKRGKKEIRKKKKKKEKKDFYFFFKRFAATRVNIARLKRNVIHMITSYKLQ
ncbi:hypothetical protein PUN28_011086 [Cardiocondyla obscurior]|uniref:Uncharacterized protein n=1 Tax=Cardiocondyla obscurior TaxID=286306 RepID=A0AAW2FPW8_9HYME